jgi:hypothetical protein
MIVEYLTINLCVRKALILSSEHSFEHGIKFLLLQFMIELDLPQLRPD